MLRKEPYQLCTYEPSLAERSPCVGVLRAGRPPGRGAGARRGGGAAAPRQLRPGRSSSRSSRRLKGRGGTPAMRPPQATPAACPTPARYGLCQPISGRLPPQPQHPPPACGHPGPAVGPGQSPHPEQVRERGHSSALLDGARLGAERAHFERDRESGSALAVAAGAVADERLIVPVGCLGWVPWQGGGFRGCPTARERPCSQPGRARGPASACHRHAGAPRIAAKCLSCFAHLSHMHVSGAASVSCPSLSATCLF